MTKQLACVIEGCHAAIEAESEEEVMKQAEAHASDTHPDLELDDETVTTLRANIRDV